MFLVIPWTYRIHLIFLLSLILCTYSKNSSVGVFSDSLNSAVEFSGVQWWPAYCTGGSDEFAIVVFITPSTNITWYDWYNLVNFYIHFLFIFSFSHLFKIFVFKFYIYSWLVFFPSPHFSLVSLVAHWSGDTPSSFRVRRAEFFH